MTKAIPNSAIDIRFARRLKVATILAVVLACGFFAQTLLGSIL